MKKRTISDMFGPGAPRRRTWLASGAAVAAVLLLLVGLPQLFRDGSLVGFGAEPTSDPSMSVSPSAPDATPSPTSSSTPSPSVATDVPARSVLTTTVGTSSVGPWVITLFEATATYQLAAIMQPGQPKARGQVAVYEAGAYDATEAYTGIPTQVHGHPAWYLPAGTTPGTEAGHYDAAPILEPMIAWQYATSSWAIVTGTFFLDGGASAPTDAVPAALVQVAEGVVIGDPQPVRLPFKLGYVPTGLAPVRVILGGSDSLACVIDFGPADGSGPDQRNSTAPYYDLLMVSMHGLFPLGQFASVTLAGHEAVPNGNQYDMNLDGFGVTIGSGQLATRLPDAEIVRIFNNMTFADWNDASTWFSIQ